MGCRHRLTFFTQQVKQSKEALDLHREYTVGNKNSKDSTAVYVEALLKIPEAACAVCKAYRRDYDCLGYQLPEVCATSCG